jgi:hypothetical protein
MEESVALEQMAKMTALATFLALSACAGTLREARPAATERLDGQGTSASALSIESGGRLRFVNDDSRPHQIYSNDCPELSSPLLGPGDSFTATVGAGAKVCHFEDLLAPSASAYAGTVGVKREADLIGNPYCCS